MSTEPLNIAVTKKGFGQDSIALLPGQGMVFRFATPARIAIELVEPDDGPKKSKKKAGPAARYAKQGEE